MIKKDFMSELNSQRLNSVTCNFGTSFSHFKKEKISSWLIVKVLGFHPRAQDYQNLLKEVNLNTGFGLVWIYPFTKSCFNLPGIHQKLRLDPKFFDIGDTWSNFCEKLLDSTASFRHQRLCLCTYVGWKLQNKRKKW